MVDVQGHCRDSLQMVGTQVINIFQNISHFKLQKTTAIAYSFYSRKVVMVVYNLFLWNQIGADLS